MIDGSTLYVRQWNLGLYVCKTPQVVNQHNVQLIVMEGDQHEVSQKHSTGPTETSPRYIQTTPFVCSGMRVIIHVV